MTKLTKRQKIHIRSYFQTGLVLLLALGLLFGLGALVTWGIRSAIGPREVPEAAAAQPEPPAETAVPTDPQPAAAPLSTPNLPEPPAVDVDSWELRLVRREHPLPEDFEPELMYIDDDQLFDARAGMHLTKLLQDARAAGFTTYVCSGYRSYETQYWLYWGHVSDYEKEGKTREEAERLTAIAVNYPGGSEHQLGLAADVLEFRGQDMEPYIGGSGLMLWLEEHCADYGFVIRYPKDKTDITGIEYEPWHLRFVGSCARYLMENDLCLEEFLALYE